MGAAGRGNGEEGRAIENNRRVVDQARSGAARPLVMAASRRVRVGNLEFSGHDPEHEDDVE